MDTVVRFQGLVIGSSKSNLMEAIVEAAGVEAALVEGQSLPSRIPSEPTMENQTIDTISYHTITAQY